MLTKPIHFVVMKSPWIKSKINPGPNKTKIENLAESDKDSWFNHPSENETASASSLDVLAVSKKKK